jgi:hypothetical protein
VELARDYGVPIFPSIRQALFEGSSTNPATMRFDLDGVVLIGEHGDYPRDEYGRTLYPQRYMFEQICGVFAEVGRACPVYCDKHLSYCAADALWMMGRAKELKVPLLAGSSLVTCWRRPNLEPGLGEFDLIEACALGVCVPHTSRGTFQRCATVWPCAPRTSHRYLDSQRWGDFWLWGRCLARNGSHAVLNRAPPGTSLDIYRQI